MLNPDQLRTFIAAADSQNFTRAGELLHISQPTVSQHIRELETRLEVTLFERKGRRMALTPAGERLRPLAKASIAHLERTMAAMDEFRGVPQSVLRLGATGTVGIYLLPQALGQFSRRYPGIRASLQINEPDQIHRGLRDGELDIGLVSFPPPPGQIVGWSCHPFQEDEVVLIASPQHPFAQRREIEAGELSGLPVILRQPQSPTRQLILDTLANAGFDHERMRIRFELGHTEGLKRAVMANLGVAFVSRYAIAAEAAAGWVREIPIRDLHIRRSLWLIHRGPDSVTIHEERFADLILSRAWETDIAMAATNPQDRTL
jgi:DNA-binding transcriptional LysR family regulator